MESAKTIDEIPSAVAKTEPVVAAVAVAAAAVIPDAGSDRKQPVAVAVAAAAAAAVPDARSGKKQPPNSFGKKKIKRGKRKESNGANSSTAQPTSAPTSGETSNGPKNNNKHNGRPRNRQPLRHIPQINSMFVAATDAPKFGPANGPGIVPANIGVKPSSQPDGSNTLGWEFNDTSFAADSEYRNFWDRQPFEYDRKARRRKKRTRIKSENTSSSYHLVAFAASASVVEERADDNARNKEPDVVSLSDDEDAVQKSEQLDKECVSTGDLASDTNGARGSTTGTDKDFVKQLQTLPVLSSDKMVELQNAVTCDEIEGRQPKDEKSEEPPEKQTAAKDGNAGTATPRTTILKRASGTNEKPANKEVTNKEMNEAKEQSANNAAQVGQESTSKVIQKKRPLVIKKESFDGLDLTPGLDKYVQNGEIEVKIEKQEGKDFIQIILQECYGSPEDPKYVARNGYKICTSAVLHEETPVEIMRKALLDLGEHLEQISRDSLDSGDKVCYDVNQYSLPYLEKQSIYPLKKKSARFTRAVYYCRICQYHICSVSHAVSHFSTREHVDNCEKTEILKKVECFPYPVQEQMFKVDQVIREHYVFTRFNDSQYEVGTRIASILSIFLEKEAHKGYSVVLYGSYLFKMATAESNLNLALNYPLEYSLGQALSRVMEVLEDDKIEKEFVVHSVTSDFQRADPSIRCFINSIPVVITTNCLRQQRATELINLYCTIRSQFRILATVFRSWAEECSLTNLQLGGMPKVAFDIMLIYYLQRKNLLPFVFEILSEDELLQLDSESLEFEHQVDKINAEFGTDTEEWNFGELWIGLFRYYAIEHSVDELIQMRWKEDILPRDNTRWNRKRLAIEDPFAADHIMQPQQHIHGYFASCFLATYLHFALPRTELHSLIPYTTELSESGPMPMKKKKRKGSRSAPSKEMNSDEAAMEEKQQQKEENNLDDVSALCDDMKNLEMNEAGEAVAEQKSAPAAEYDLETGKEDSAEEATALLNEDSSGDDGSAPVEKVVDEVPAVMMESSDNCTTARSYDTPQQQESNEICSVELTGDVNAVKLEENGDESLWDSPKTCQELETPVCDETDISVAEISACENDLQVLEEVDVAEKHYDRTAMMALRENDNLHPEVTEHVKELGLLPPVVNQNSSSEKGYDEKGEVMQEIKLATHSLLKIKFDEYDEKETRKLWMDLHAGDYAYPWLLECFTGGLAPVVRCTCCSIEGHLRDTCPELYVPTPAKLRPLSSAQKELLDDIIVDVFEAMRIRPFYVHRMSSLCHELEVCLRRDYRSDCRLSLFGSAGNGFGLLGSDADICLRFGPNVKAGDVDPVEAISEVAKVVRTMPDAVCVVEVPHAKVPIVKFCCRKRNGLEADVSLYNVLALENTRLLRAYSEVDIRIHQLGIMIKEWAKGCQICDASKGSLSSYSYIIMLIHYLQRTEPPVAPFLQEMAPVGKRREPKIVDGCDVYFCDLEELEWCAQNQSGVADLWLGFLSYFAMKFDFTREVIQIRQAQPLTKLDKGWQSRPIAIEDPFDLNHNLSSGVHSKTMAYIMKTFVRSREKFSTLRVPRTKLNYDGFVRYTTGLLDSCLVGDGPPLDRNCCHRCRQIGHYVENCPLGQKDKKRMNGVKPAKSGANGSNGRRGQSEGQSTDDNDPDGKIPNGPLKRQNSNNNPARNERRNKRTVSETAQAQVERPRSTSETAEADQPLDLNEQNFPALSTERLNEAENVSDDGWGASCKPPWHKKEHDEN